MEQVLSELTSQFESFQFASTLTYALFLALPVNVAMVAIGFINKNACPLDARIPRYLVFGGLAGLVACLLRIIVVLIWKRTVNKNGGE